MPQMLVLLAVMGPATGDPLECVRADPDTGDLLQQTTRGLLIYRTTTGVASFTNGWTRWAITPSGFVSWFGSGLDPPWVELLDVPPTTPGGPARTTVHTSPGATCWIDYLTPAGVSSRASGLEPRTADMDGYASWSWRVGPSTRRGVGQVVVSCDGASASASLVIE